MAMSGGGKAGGIKSEINVTPLVDVVLVLLIIFMVITPMLQRGKDVTLPQSVKTDEDNKDPDPIILSITKNKQMYFDKYEYDEKGLEEKLKTERASTRHILLKGDVTLTYADIRKVMNVARKAGAKGIQLGVEEIKK